ncbi:unnamed protein product [Bursaphelenchus xylophilus]|uniref:Exportin-4 n=1 Tax=Bursaphelenchus xylophilus TaxID=6326 RepID=A0A1I7S362_BURXY|nr:unnamed protein product [Bursaphelenchus xylophilus]CAG9116108.1 unnamed protein product [Bursaphelenchus xylophilus]
MENPSELSNEIAKMEEAARILMGENSPLHQRREAESYFVQMKEAGLDPNICRVILETTREPVVMFQIAQCLCSSLVKNFVTSNKQDLINICTYMLEMPLKSNQLPGYVVAEVLKVAATLVKRGIIASDPWDVEFVLEFISKLLDSEEENMQALGLRVVEAISIEFSTMWRASSNMGFDFHHKAKRKFEEIMLKRFMQMSLSALSRIISSSSSVNERVCDRFLKVAVIVLQWNFTTSIKTAFLKVNLYSMNSAVALRPPPSWADLFTNDDLLPFFFGLHKKVRHNSQLAENSLSCITQLAAVMGSCLDNRSKEKVAGVPQPHDLYVQRFCSNLIETFQDCFPYEVLPFTTSLHRIFSHHPMPIFKRFPDDLMGSFVNFIVYWCGQLAQPSMMEQKDDESVLVEAYTHCLTCWGILLRSCPTFPKASHDLIEAENSKVIESFLKAILAPPFGSRSISDDDAADMEDEELDDTQYYSIILNNVGVFCRLSIDSFSEFVIRVFHERIQQRTLIMSGQISEQERILWLEDIHWILLMVGSFFHDSDREIYMYLERGYSSKKFQLLDMATFILQCASSDEFQPPESTDNISIIIGLVCHWFGIAYRSLDTEGDKSRIVSAELYRTSFLTFSVLINFLTNLNDETPSQFFEDADPNSSAPMPVLPSNGEFSVQLIDFIIKQIFTAFKTFPAEKKLCNAAVGLLLQESEKRAEFIAKSPLLYELISTITLERLPARRNFMTCLVTIGSNVNSTREREQMHDMILKPMAARFMEASQQYFAGNMNIIPHLVDLLECFSGIARAAQIESGSILYEFLLPILRVSCNMIRIAVDSQLLVEAILDVFHKVATTVFVFMDLKNNGSEEENSFIMLLMELLDNYKESQMRRFNRGRAFADLEQEEQIADLVMLLKIISNTISKPYIMYGSPSDVSDHLSLPLCQKTLNMMLPLMCEDCLQLPSLSGAFFRLLQHITECCPTVFLSLDELNVNQLFVCFSWALSGAASTEPTRLTLDCIATITKTLSNSTDTANGGFTVRMFKDLCGKSFEMAVHSTAEVELHGSAIKAVFGFIALNKSFFMEYVNSVISRPENEAKREFAVKAFMDLIPQSESLNTRQEYKAFSDRFEKFLEIADTLII